MTQNRPVCQRAFRNKTALESHARTEHNQFFQCPGCPKRITYSKNFVKHFVDARHGTSQDAKIIQKTLKPQYTMDFDIEDGMYIIRFNCDMCLLAVLWYIGLAPIVSAEKTLVCRRKSCLQKRTAVQLHALYPQRHKSNTKTYLFSIVIVLLLQISKIKPWMRLRMLNCLHQRHRNNFS